MPKLYYGSRGGVYYKRKGRKVYINRFGMDYAPSSSDSEPSFVTPFSSSNSNFSDDDESDVDSLADALEGFNIEGGIILEHMQEQQNFDECIKKLIGELIESDMSKEEVQEKVNNTLFDDKSSCYAGNWSGGYENILNTIKKAYGDGFKEQWNEATNNKPFPEKLQFGSRGGLYYRRKGRKVYVNRFV